MDASVGAIVMRKQMQRRCNHKGRGLLPLREKVAQRASKDARLTNGLWRQQTADEGAVQDEAQ
jgi:hypothetical protein